MNYEVRKPTTEEKDQLKEYIFLDLIHDYDYEEITENINNAHIGIIDKYTSDTPGYVGKLLFVVWGFTGAYELYGWDKQDMIYKIDKEI